MFTYSPYFLSNKDNIKLIRKEYTNCAVHAIQASIQAVYGKMSSNCGWGAQLLLGQCFKKSASQVCRSASLQSASLQVCVCRTSAAYPYDSFNSATDPILSRKGPV